MCICTGKCKRPGCTEKGFKEHAGYCGPTHKKIRNKGLSLQDKLDHALRALEVYARLDLWSWGHGEPKIVDKEKYGDGEQYNVFGLRPAQEGWEFAEQTLKDIRGDS